MWNNNNATMITTIPSRERKRPCVRMWIYWILKFIETSMWSQRNKLQRPIVAVPRTVSNAPAKSDWQLIGYNELANRNRFIVRHQSDITESGPFRFICLNRLHLPIDEIGNRWCYRTTAYWYQWLLTMERKYIGNRRKQFAFKLTMSWAHSEPFDLHTN